MEYRQNADWRENDHSRDGDGKFTDKQASFDRQQADKEKPAAKFSDKDSKPKPKRSKQVKLQKQEYAVLRRAVIEKNLLQKGNVKPTNYAFTSNNFYYYKTSGYDRFKIVTCMPIDGNEYKINKYIKEIDGR